MSDLIRIGMDTSKNLFQLHGVDAEERAVLRKRLTRGQMLDFFQKSPPVTIGIEACGASHHWARTLSALGHRVKIIPAHLVKPYIPRNKNDAADAQGLCEAMSRPAMRFVPAKTTDQQAALMLMAVRDRLVIARTALINSIRGHAAEFGLIAPLGPNKMEAFLERIVSDADVPELARALFSDLAAELKDMTPRIVRLDARMNAFKRENETVRRLMTIPGIGPVGAMLLTLKAPDPHGFKSGRDFSAWMGLTCRDHSTAGRRRSGGITRAGDEKLRATLVAGAMSVIQQRKRGRGAPWPWLARMIMRKPMKLAAVALANKIARIAWKLMASGQTYAAPSLAEAA